MRRHKAGIKNVLFILSPLAPENMSRNACYDAAKTLKDMGATRVDLAMDPRVAQALSSSSHIYKSPVSDFTNVAVGLVQAIFQPLVGESGVFDLDGLETQLGRNLYNLTSVGEIFARSVFSQGRILPPNGVDGRDLGLIFHVTLNARTMDNETYDHLVFSGMTDQGRNAFGVLDDELLGMDVGPHGPIINLNATRYRMQELRVM